MFASVRFLLAAAVTVAAVHSQSLVRGNAVERSGTVIGFLLPPEEAQAASLREGVLLAIERAKARGLAVEVVIRGRVGQWGADAGEAARMVTEDGAVGLIASPNGAASHLALQIAGRTAVPVVSLCPDSSVSLTGVPWMVRMSQKTMEEAKALMADYGRTNRCVALVPRDRAGREIARDLKLAAKGIGCLVEKTIEVANPPKGLDSIGPAVLGSGVSLVLVWLDPAPAGTIVRTLREAGFTGQLAGPGVLACPEFAAVAREAAEGFRVPAIRRDPESRRVFQAFQVAYHDRYSHEPAALAALSFDAAMLLIDLVGQGNGVSARERFPLRCNLPGASGRLEFDAQGNRKLDLELLTFHAGRFVPNSLGQTRVGTN